MVQLSYKDPFPTDDDIEAMRANTTQEKEA